MNIGSIQYEPNKKKQTSKRVKAYTKVSVESPIRPFIKPYTTTCNKNGKITSTTIGICTTFKKKSDGECLVSGFNIGGFDLADLSGSYTSMSIHSEEDFLLVNSVETGPFLIFEPPTYAIVFNVVDSDKNEIEITEFKLEFMAGLALTLAKSKNKLDTKRNGDETKLIRLNYANENIINVEKLVSVIDVQNVTSPKYKKSSDGKTENGKTENVKTKLSSSGSLRELTLQDIPIMDLCAYLPTTKIVVVNVGVKIIDAETTKE